MRDCRDELKRCASVRADLAAWAPPEPDSRLPHRAGSAEPSSVARVVDAGRGLAAAAVLVLAAASAIAHVRSRDGPDGLTVRTGWSAAACRGDRCDASAAAAGAQPAARGRVSRRIDAPARGARAPADALEAAVARRRRAQRVDRMSARATDAEIMRRVRDLLAQSETKQQEELALRITQVIRDVDAQRSPT